MYNKTKNKENVTPVWFMRQAGRYLPEYKLIRQRKKNFFDLCFSPRLASEISLQPIKRFNFDFIILFSDILVIPHCLGQKVEFKENVGPLLNPITSLKDLEIRKTSDHISKLSPIFETVMKLNDEKRDKKLIGFCGGAFTVLNYMIEGKSSKDHNLIKSYISEKKQAALDLIDVIVEVSIEYLKRQIQEGADYIQVFESWAGLLEDEEEYFNFIIKPNQRISEEIRKFSPKTKIIHFPRGSKQKIVEFIRNVKCDVLSLDRDPPEEIFTICKENQLSLQGNLDPEILKSGGKKLINEVHKIMKKFRNYNHIFNLSHGILPTTPIENVEKTINLVRNYEFAE